jgi:hypothetical protein
MGFLLVPGNFTYVGINQIEIAIGIAIEIDFFILRPFDFDPDYYSAEYKHASDGFVKWNFLQGLFDCAI